MMYVIPGRGLCPRAGIQGHRPVKVSNGPVFLDSGPSPFGLSRNDFMNSEEARSMEFGASIFFTDYSISSTELAMAMEERGLDALWVAEHSHIPVPRRTPAPGGGELPKRYYDVMDPFVTLATAAVVTKQLKLGTGVCLVIQRDA